MFVGYLSSFFIALLLSFFYLGYAASGVFEQIKKEIKKEAGTELTETISNTDCSENYSIFDYVTNIPESNRQVVNLGFVIDIPLICDRIPIRKVCLSDHFLRPPPELQNR
jgi:hypothetical protein